MKPGHSTRHPVTVVCDTNIYISSLISASGAPDEVLALGRHGAITIAVSQPILLELEKVLTRKFLVKSATVTGILAEIRAFTMAVTPALTLDLVKGKEADNRILECAAAAGAQYIVSGDRKHLLPLKRCGQTRILSPADFLKALDHLRTD